MRAAALALVLAGCSYGAQWWHGQLELQGNAKPIERVIADPHTSLRTAMMLAEISEIKAYARSYGLVATDNYRTYVQLDHPAALWVVVATDAVSFLPHMWCFGFIGSRCLASLEFFDEDDAVAQRIALETQGLDTLARPAEAFSTGGRFSDPVLSSMLHAGNDALPSLADTIFHESVHVTVTVEDEPEFDEGFATYVADAITDHWIESRFGRGSPEELAWTLGRAVQYPMMVRFFDTYEQLDALYRSGATRAVKLAGKAKIIAALIADGHLRWSPNNAALIETHTYYGAEAQLHAAHRACGDLGALIAAAKTLEPRDFRTKFQTDLTSIGVLLGQRCHRRS